jgi:hypothetical protein
MASRDKHCGHLMPPLYPLMPRPELLAQLAPVMYVLMNCAAEFDSIDDEGCWTAVEWVRWLDLECRGKVA